MCNYETLESMATREAHRWEESVNWQRYRNHTLSVRILNTEALTKCHFYSSLQMGKDFFRDSLSGRNSRRDWGGGNQQQMDCRLMKRKLAPHQLVAKATMSWTAPAPLSPSSQPRRGGQGWWKHASLHIVSAVHKYKEGCFVAGSLCHQAGPPGMFGTHEIEGKSSS